MKFQSNCNCNGLHLHVIHPNSGQNIMTVIQIDGRQRAGRPKLTWKKLTEKDCREWKLTTVDPQERSTSRSGVRSGMHAPSLLRGRGPTDVMMPLHLQVNQKSDYVMI